MHVLVADDTSGDLTAAALRAIEPSWRVASCASLRSLDVLLGAVVPDVLVLDLRLGADGPDAVLDVAHLPRRGPRARILLASGDDRVRDVAQGRGLPYLLKPYSVEELRDAVLDAAKGP